MDFVIYNRILRQRRSKMRKIRRSLRDMSDPFEWLTDAEFKRHFRFDKAILRDIVLELSPHMHEGVTYHSISPTLKILTAMNFLANGSYQRPTGISFLAAVSQTSVSRIVQEVVNCINTTILKKVIIFPQSRESRETISEKFYQKYGFPGIIGVIDGTHILIRKPHNDIEHAYYSVRKASHSKNVQIVFDFDYNILSINARYGGAHHDSYIWNNSMLRSILEKEYRDGVLTNWLLGDSGYGIQPWLLTPYRNATTTSEERYNVCHKMARCTVERGIGILKSRFRCLSKQRVLMYTPAKSGSIINACAGLHNFLQNRGFPLPTEDEIEQHMDDEDENIEDTENMDQLSIVNEGNRIRNSITRNYFS